MVPRGTAGWDIGPAIPMGPSPWSSWNARSHGHLHKGQPLYIHTSYPRISAIFADGSRALCRGTLLFLTLSIPPGEAKLPVCVWWDAHLHPEGRMLLWFYASNFDTLQDKNLLLLALIFLLFTLSASNFHQFQLLKQSWIIYPAFNKNNFLLGGILLAKWADYRHCCLSVVCPALLDTCICISIRPIILLSRNGLF